MDLDSKNNTYKANEDFWNSDPKLKEYIFFGHNNMFKYCKKPKNETYYLMDKSKKYEIAKMQTLEEIVLFALKGVYWKISTMQREYPREISGKTLINVQCIKICCKELLWHNGT
jgi:hypothetical protein